ncbi:MAG TPA: NAD-dependent succinate-semialdehyde dehydrogenase, partial [Anaerolineae bacterium]|nr:NAD-dependent succinate-semialdehyde dehydrogenase [Anaerolineae bacterium]
ESVNPATGEIIAVYDEMDDGQVQAIIEKADRVYTDWRTTGFEERAGLMRNAAELLHHNSRHYAELMAAEMGKPVREGRAEAEKCAWVCDYYAENAAAFLQKELIETDASKSYITFQPLGVVLAVMPWNFPFWQVFRFAAPALMAGNAAVLKHASNVSGCALAIEDVFRQAGFPQGLFATLLIRNTRVEAVIDNPLIKAATLTGSTPAGRAVAGKAGSALKKTVLELGGSDPYVILKDADLEATVETCVTSRLINSGQSCIAAKRFIVVQPLYEKFIDLFVDKMRSKKMGDPLHESTVVGPLARFDLREELHFQVRASIDKGARCLLGGQMPEGQGAFYPPTVLAEVAKGMPAFDEETFGPVAAVIPAADEREAIRLANDTCFGLGAAVFTRNIAHGEQIAAQELQAGCCFVNAFVKSDPRLPFGGIKESGYGRELSHYGIKEFVNIKTVY